MDDDDDLVHFGLPIMLLIAALVGAVLFFNAPARGHHSELHTWLLTWISGHCCVTNDCCKEVHSSEITSLPEDNWRINATGQVLKRTAFSPDGKYYRCFCDYDSESGKWIVHQKANTRCLFTPMLGF